MTDAEIDALSEAGLEANLSAAFGIDATGCCKSAAKTLALLARLGTWVKIRDHGDGTFTLKVDDRVTGKKGHGSDIMKATARAAMKCFTGLQSKRKDSLEFQRAEKVRLEAQLSDTNETIARVGG